MVEIRIEKDEIAFRAVWLGARATNPDAAIDSLRSALPDDSIGRPVLYRADEARLIAVDHRPQPERVFDLDVCFQHCAVVEGEVGAAALSILLGGADALIILADESTEPSTVENALDALEDAGRAPGSVPVVVCTANDDVDVRRRLGIRRRGWEVQYASGTDAERRAFEVTSRPIIERYREYEADLERRGLDKHVRIGETIFERVEVPEGAAGAGDDEKTETRLIEAVDAPDSFWMRHRARVLIAAAFIALAGAAFVVASFL